MAFKPRPHKTSRVFAFDQRHLSQTKWSWNNRLWTDRRSTEEPLRTVILTSYFLVPSLTAARLLVAMYTRLTCGSKFTLYYILRIRIIYGYGSKANSQFGVISPCTVLPCFLRPWFPACTLRRDTHSRFIVRSSVAVSWSKGADGPSAEHLLYRVAHWLLYHGYLINKVSWSPLLRVPEGGILSDTCSERSEVSYSGYEVKVWLQWPYVLRPF